MSTQLIRSGECRKFSPNIFNKTKCANCFRQKEEHTAEALESNRATRKIAKCGYLFVAPGWDFTNPANRTKRWQRRWFVLYDDGELSYALDEHPETVPQASIDMNKVVEVTNAEELTGNAFSLAITAPDNVHFVKGTSREEIRFWTDVLSVFPRSKGRHKRNATFPGTQSSNKGSQNLLQTPIRNKNTSEAVRNQYNTRKSLSPSPGGPVWEGDDVFPTRDTPKTPEQTSPDTRKVYLGSPPTRDKLDDKSRTRKIMVSRDKRNVRGRSFSEDISKMVPSSPWQEKAKQGEISRRLLFDEIDGDCKLRELDGVAPTSESGVDLSDTSAHQKQFQIRGDPDGCGLDVSSRCSPTDHRVDIPSDELLNVKKGWLMKQSQDKEWTKHWFVLRGNALFFYRDTCAEEQAMLDGVIDLSAVTAVSEVHVQRNYGFQTTTWDDRRYVLSAVTASIRASWLTAIKKAAGIQQSDSDISTSIQRDQEGDSVGCGVSARSMLFSSDEEYKTASEKGRRESGEWGEALPPSPPLNRTPMSRVKERARGVSKLRVYGSKRSRSSPPTSRRSTLDSVSSQDVVSASTVSSPPASETKISTAEYPGDDQELSYRLWELGQDEVSPTRLLRQPEDSRRPDSAQLEAIKKRYVEEKAAWEAWRRAAEAELEAAAGRVAGLSGELSVSREAGAGLRARLLQLEERLAASENQDSSGLAANLRTRLIQLEERLAASNQALRFQSLSRSRSLDSLSDLTNFDLDLDHLSQIDRERLVEEYVEVRVRLEKAVSEIRAMKRELRDSQGQADWLELSLVSCRQEALSRQQEAEASSSLMASRVQDLACKLSAAEKQIRSLKQKLSKTETREKRRSLSLKGRESFTISKEFEDKLSELEKKVSCIDVKVESTGRDKKADKLAARLRRKSLDSATSSEPMKVLLRLNTLEAKIAKVSEPSAQANELKLFNGTDEVDTQSEIFSEVKKMENLLRAKLVVLAKKKESLIKAGQWTNEAQLNLLAEKLAYESVLVGRLHDAVIDNKTPDTVDAERLIDSLDEKLNGSGTTNIETSLDYLARALSKHLAQQSVKRASRKPKDKRKQDPLLGQLLKKKTVIDTKVTEYINTSVVELAQVLALESLAQETNGSAQNDYCQTAWKMAQEAVNQELIQEEIVQVISQCCGDYHNSIEAEKQSRFIKVVRDRANLEAWASMASEKLKTNMNMALEKVRNEFEYRLEQLKNQPDSRKPTQLEEETTRQALQHLTDIIAHKSLLDARLAVIFSDENPEIEPDGSANLEENSLLSEIQYLYVKFCRDLTQDLKDDEKVKDILLKLNNEITSLEQMMVPSENKLDTSSEKTDSSDMWIESVYKKLEFMKERVMNIQKFAKSCRDCKKCFTMQQEITRIEKEHSIKIKNIDKMQEDELKQLREEFEREKEDMIKKQLEEEEILLENNRRLERKVEELRQQYQEEVEHMQSCCDPPEIEDNTLHTRYQREIQHLKAVCEKGLSGMEKAHRRQVEELQQKHDRELESLRLEKEQALAEETHATLAALDAMRKAHEAEVQKEITKFKTEFLSKMHTNHDFSAIHRQHQAEMSDIKHEILSLSEKYSVKCVENSLLEDKLRCANQQLSNAHQHIVQLDNRYKQLKAQLSGEVSQDSSPSISRLHELTHGVVTMTPRIVHFTPKQTSGSCGNEVNNKPRVRSQLIAPAPLSKTEVRRCPEQLSVCGMVSRRREEFERRAAPATCSLPSRLTLP